MLNIGTLTGRYLDSETLIEIQENSQGEKEVHFLGYGYHADDDGAGNTCRFVEYIGFYGTLKEVIKQGIYDYETEYSGDCNESAMNLPNWNAVEDVVFHDYGITRFIYESGISEDTPCGRYIVGMDSEH